MKSLGVPRLFPPQAETVDKGHGRIETRQIWVSGKLNDYLDFPHVGQVARIVRITTGLNGGIVKGRKKTTVESFIISSLTPGQAKPAKLLEYGRGHWGIENSLHYVRDMAFDEDRSQVRKRNRPRLMASLRNLVISILKLAGAKNIAAATRELSRRPLAIAKLISLPV